MCVFIFVSMVIGIMLIYIFFNSSHCFRLFVVCDRQRCLRGEGEDEYAAASGGGRQRD